MGGVWRMAVVLAGGLALGGCQAVEMSGPAASATRQPVASAAPLPAEPGDRGVPRVYLIRGLAQTVSEGVDHLAARLRARGYRASVHAYGDWPAIAARIEADRSASGGRSRAVVVGHSLGANSTVHAVNALAARGVVVDLAVTFDPTTDLQVRGGVRRFINLYQSDNGWGRRVAAADGASGRVENVDLKGMAHLTHFTIDRDSMVHDRVMQAVRSSVGEPPGSRRARIAAVSG